MEVQQASRADPQDNGDLPELPSQFTAPSIWKVLLTPLGFSGVPSVESPRILHPSEGPYSLNSRVLWPVWP